MNIKKNVILIVAIIILVGGIGYYFIKNQSFAPINTAYASVTLISPKDGEQWTVGTKQVIKWGTSNLPKETSIGIELTSDGLNENGYWENIGSSQNTGEYTWEIPKVISNGPLKICIYAYEVNKKTKINDCATTYFTGSTATPPQISQISPSSGSLPPDVNTGVINENQVKEIVISGSGFITNDDNFGKNDIYFASGTASRLFGSFSIDGNTLTIPYLPSTMEDVTKNGYVPNIKVVPGKYEIFIKNASGKSNNVTFTVEGPTTPSIKIIQPIGGEVWKIGSTYSIKWVGENIPIDGPRTIRIVLSDGIVRSDGIIHATDIFGNIINNGQVNWTIPSDITPGDYKLTISCSYPYLNDCPGGEEYNYNSFKIIK